MAQTIIIQMLLTARIVKVSFVMFPCSFLDEVVGTSKKRKSYADMAYSSQTKTIRELDEVFFYEEIRDLFIKKLKSRGNKSAANR